MKEGEHKLLSFETFDTDEELSLGNTNNLQQDIPARVKVKKLLSPEEVASAGPNRVKMYCYSVTE